MCVTPTVVAKDRGAIRSPTNQYGELNCTLTLTNMLPGSRLELYIGGGKSNLYPNCRSRGGRGQYNFFRVSAGKTIRCRPRESIKYLVMSTSAAITFYSTDFRGIHRFMLRYRG